MQQKTVASFRLDPSSQKESLDHAWLQKKRHFSDTFNALFSLKCDLTSILRKPLSLLVPTDSKPLFDVIISLKYTTEKRLMIYISAAKEGVHHRDITSICLIKSEDNIAVAMINLTSNNSCSATESVTRIGGSCEEVRCF
jgi:hypothetical protein